MPYTNVLRQRDHQGQTEQIELHDQRYEAAPPLLLTNSTSAAGGKPTPSKEKAMKAVSNDYECVGFTNHSFAALTSGQSCDPMVTIELGDGEEKIDLTDDSENDD